MAILKGRSLKCSRSSGASIEAAIEFLSSAAQASAVSARGSPFLWARRRDAGGFDFTDRLDPAPRRRSGSPLQKCSTSKVTSLAEKVEKHQSFLKADKSSDGPRKTNPKFGAPFIQARTSLVTSTTTSGPVPARFRVQSASNQVWSVFHHARRPVPNSARHDLPE